MKVLITGANGFVGKNLQLHLAERKDVAVVCFDRSDDVADLPALQAPNADALERLQGAAEQADALGELQAALEAKGMGDLFVAPTPEAAEPEQGAASDLADIGFNDAVKKEATQAAFTPENGKNTIKNAEAESAPSLRPFPDAEGAV